MGTIKLATVFRGLIILQLMGVVASGWIAIKEPAAPDDKLFDSLGSGGIIIFLLISAVSLVAYLASTIGLLYFRNWARLFVTFGGIPFGIAFYIGMLAMGYNGQSSFARTVADCVTDTSAGAVLALMWASDLRTRFDKKMVG